MKITPCLLPLCFAVATVAAEPAPALSPSASAPTAPDQSAVPGLIAKPELRGMVITTSEKRFMLAAPNGAHSDWIGMGDQYGGWKLKDYHPSDGTLILSREGASDLALVMADSHVQPETKATLADAQAVLRKMDFEAMLKRIVDQQRQAVAAMTKQMMARRGLSADDADKIAERQKKVQDALYAAMDPATMKEDFAQIYSDVFTKEELAGIADFYDTPSGQAMISKMPEIQQKTMQVIMPRVMQAMAQVQQSMGPAAPSGGVQPAAAAAPAGSAPAAAGSAGKP